MVDDAILPRLNCLSKHKYSTSCQSQCPSLGMSVVPWPCEDLACPPASSYNRMTHYLAFTWSDFLKSVLLIHYHSSFLRLLFFYSLSAHNHGSRVLSLKDRYKPRQWYLVAGLCNKGEPVCNYLLFLRLSKWKHKIKSQTEVRTCMQTPQRTTNYNLRDAGPRV